MRKFKAGVTILAQIHPKANKWDYTLSGEWKESEKTYTKGTLFHASKGEAHSPYVAKAEVVSLTFFDGPLTIMNAC
ncbi:MAG: hypothetical protein HOI15_01905 [Opitutales bacterium]|nr:hypothetical protein [Opitutales bacterium]MBT5813094.1 hypothetical protein [Opitutales bacterium]